VTKGCTPSEIRKFSRNVIGRNVLRRAKDSPANHGHEGVEHPRSQADPVQNGNRIGKILCLATQQSDRQYRKQIAENLDPV